MLNEEQVHTFARLRMLQAALNAGRLCPVLSWATEHRAALRQRNSPLAYMLHRRQFLNLALACIEEDVSLGETTSARAAFAYAQAHIAPFIDEAYLPQVQQLYALLLYLPAQPLQTSGVLQGAIPRSDLLACVPPRYRSLLDACAAEDTALSTQLHKDYCAISNLSRIDALQATVDVGANYALSRILKARQVMRQRGNEWSQASELPVEIPLPPELQLHSTFLCPVSREPGTDANPPMRQPCGHVLCRDSLVRLERNGRVKCPYCPAEARVQDALRVYF